MKSFIVVCLAIQINHPHHLVANKNKCYRVQALCDMFYVHYLFNTPSKAHTVIFSLLELEKPQVVRAHRFIGGVLGLGFSDEWVDDSVL